LPTQQISPTFLELEADIASRQFCVGKSRKLLRGDGRV
jgi:hypothetical protein